MRELTRTCSCRESICVIRFEKQHAVNVEPKHHHFGVQGRLCNRTELRNGGLQALCERVCRFRSGSVQRVDMLRSPRVLVCIRTFMLITVKHYGKSNALQTTRGTARVKSRTVVDLLANPVITRQHNSQSQHCTHKKHKHHGTQQNMIQCAYHHDRKTYSEKKQSVDGDSTPQDYRSAFDHVMGREGEARKGRRSDPRWVSSE